MRSMELCMRAVVATDNISRIGSGSTVMSKLCKEGSMDKAFQAVQIMEQQGIPVSSNILFSLLEGCARQKDLESARKVKSIIVHSGLDSSSCLNDPLIRLYASSGSLLEANNVFIEVINPSVYTWSAIISANANDGHGERALEFYQKMCLAHTKCDSHAYVAVLKACTITEAWEQGRLLHGEIIETRHDFDMIVGNSLVDMYGKCGNLGEARRVFNNLLNRDVISYNTLVAGYASHGLVYPALELFEEMQQQRIRPERATFLSIFKACGTIGLIDRGRLTHEQIMNAGLDLDVIVGSALIDMYAKCGSLEEAWNVFDGMSYRNAVSWAALIGGYVQQGQSVLAIDAFERMEHDCIQPNISTYVSVLKACSLVSALEQGRLLHNKIIRDGLESHVVIGSALADMYAKCGTLEETCNVFDSLSNRNLISWSAMIAAYAWHGDVQMAGQYLEEMLSEGIKPDDVIFTSIFAACSHAGLVAEGCQYFKLMVEDHGIRPGANICNCTVDLLCRAGYLNEGEKLLKVVEPDIIGWTSLLASCRTYGNVELGRQCFCQVVLLDPQHASAYVLMSNIYNDAYMWEDANKIEELRKHACAWKKPGRAWIEVNNKVHEFIVGDRTHPQTDEVYAMLNKLSKKMKAEGYTPQFDLVMQNMSDQDKEDALCGHCEKLAIAYGLLSTPQGTTIRASKNLRVCVDCHNATKIISKIEGREIIIRDAFRIHRFKDGECSCGDYH